MTVLIIDGNSLAHRSYHGFLRSFDLVGRGVIYGFFHNILNLASQYGPTRVAVAWDSDQPTWRHKRYPEYKAGREEKPEELVSQIAKVKEGLTKLGVAQLEYPGWEADDWIGSLVWHFVIPGHNNPKVYIYSSDRDLYQLVSPYTKMLVPVEKRLRLVDEEAVKESLGVLPQQIPDYKALAGDSSDNLPGVPGIGPKTAANLLQEYESLDNIYNNIDRIRSDVRNKLTSHKDSAYMCRHLATIVTNIPMPVKDFSLKPPSFNQMSDYFRDVKLPKLSEKVPMSLGYLYRKPEQVASIVES